MGPGCLEARQFPQVLSVKIAMLVVDRRQMFNVPALANATLLVNKSDNTNNIKLLVMFLLRQVSVKLSQAC